MAELSTQSLEAHLKLCKERVLSQEARNREFSTKATGVIAFSVGLVTLSRNVLDWGRWPTWVIAACFAIVAFLALAMIIRPANWATPRNLSDSEEDVKSSDTDYDRFLITTSNAYREATEVNQKTLNSKVRVLRCMVWAALLELATAFWQFFIASGSRGV